ncbi:MAG: hypothetical protein WC455_13130 [Dehalococcoidia bacterium]|jgi:hypothetical protein
MLEYCNVNKLKLAMMLMRWRIIKSFFICETGEIRLIWPWIRI